MRHLHEPAKKTAMLAVRWSLAGWDILHLLRCAAASYLREFAEEQMRHLKVAEMKKGEAEGGWANYEVINTYELREVARDGGVVWQLMCPGCDSWQDIDDDQYNGKVSVLCHYDCGFHKTINLAALVEEKEAG